MIRLSANQGLLGEESCFIPKHRSYKTNELFEKPDKN